MRCTIRAPYRRRARPTISLLIALPQGASIFRGASGGGCVSLLDAPEEVPLCMCETPCVGILRPCGSETQTIMGPAYIPPVSAAGLGRASVAGFVWSEMAGTMDTWSRLGRGRNLVF